jgi:hypothetical protein
VNKFKNGKAAGKNRITNKMKTGGFAIMEWFVCVQFLYKLEMSKVVSEREEVVWITCWFEVCVCVHEKCIRRSKRRYLSSSWT